MGRKRLGYHVTGFTASTGDLEKLSRLAALTADGNRSLALRLLIRQAPEPISAPKPEPEKADVT